MPKVLWIGSFLSKVRGSKGVSESLWENLSADGIDGTLASRYENKLLRIADVVFKCLTTAHPIIHIDVFSGSAFQIASIASKIAKFRGKKIIMTLHGGKLVEYFETNSSSIKHVLQSANIIQTPSKFIQEFYITKGFQINYLPNSIELHKFPFDRSHVQKHTMLWVRGFMEVYNPTFAISVLHKVKETIPDCTLTMIGPDKGLLNETMLLAEKLEVKDSVSILGSIPNQELYKFYQTHELYINTTSYESFGVALVEAAACGIPMVSTSVGEIPYLWKHEEDILLSERLDVNDFARKVISIFQNEEMAKNLSRNANKKSKQFDWEFIKPKWIKMINELAS